VAVATGFVPLVNFKVHKLGALPSTFPAPHLPALDPDSIGRLLGSALAVAVLVSVGSLLSARTADGMNGSRSDNDRELFGQGLAGLLSGLFSGMPATGAIDRTVVNVRSGGRTRLAALTHALILVVAVPLGAGVLSRIPLSALAGVLMVTAARMIDRDAIATIVRSTRADAAVLGVTVIATVALDLVAAVELGVAVAGAIALRSLVHRAPVVDEQLSTSALSDDRAEAAAGRGLLSEHIVVYRLDSSLYFGAAQKFLDQLTAVCDVRVVLLRLGPTNGLDASGAHAIADVVTHLQAQGIATMIKVADPRHLDILRTVGALDALARERHVFTTFRDAIDHARSHGKRDLDIYGVDHGGAFEEKFSSGVVDDVETL
jgi:SulP family sulfate permease